MNVDNVDFHLASIQDEHGHDKILFLKTTNDRNTSDKDEHVCSICFYNSEAETDEEQEKQITKKTLYDTMRYSQMCYSNEGTMESCNVCTHHFHTVCLYNWIKSSREFKCPMCRSSALQDHTKLGNVPELFCSEPEYIVQYYPNGKVKTECYKENGMLHNFYKRYDLLGNLIYECGYYKGDKHDNEIEYHVHSTQKWKIQQYKFGSKHGYYKEYSADEDTHHGEQILLKHQEWQNGMLHGKEQEWFLARKTRKRCCNYFDGLKHGTEKIWTINGKLIFYKKYEHGRPIGRCIVRFPDNGCLERKCFYNQHGQLDGIYIEWQYACNSLTKSSSQKSSGNSSGPGVGTIIGMLTGGILNTSTPSTPSSSTPSATNDEPAKTSGVTMKIKSTYVDGVRIGNHTEYHDNGTIHIIAHYNKYGEYDGEYFEYDRFGRCKLRYLFDNGKLEGVCERYGDNGKITECGSYKNDVLDGVGCYRQYYTNGKLKIKQSYSNGILHGDSIYLTPKGSVDKIFRYDNNQLVAQNI